MSKATAVLSSGGLLVADKDLFTGNAASTEVLVRAPRLDQRNALSHDGLDLSYGEKLEQRPGVLPEPLGMAMAELRLERQDHAWKGDE